MPTKSVIVAILASVLLFGTVVSGCKRNRDQSVATAKSRRNSSKQQHELSSVRNVRPAEVLSASAYRPPVRRQRTPPARTDRRPQYNQGYYQDPYQRRSQPGLENVPPTYQVARAPAYEPLPEPVPVSQITRNAPAYYATAGSYETASAPGYPAPQARQSADNRYSHLPEYAYKPSAPRNSFTPSVPSPRPASPDLAMARARLNQRPVSAQYNQQALPPQAPVYPVQATQYTQEQPRYDNSRNIGSGRQDNRGRYEYNFNDDTPVPTIEPSQFSAPLPELEPVRYTRVASAASGSRVPQLPKVVPSVPVLRAEDMSGRQHSGQPRFEQAGYSSSSYERGSDAESADDAWVPSTAATAMYW